MENNNEEIKDINQLKDKQEHIRTTLFNYLKIQQKKYNFDIHWIDLYYLITTIDSNNKIEYRFDPRLIEMYELRAKYIIKTNPSFDYEYSAFINREMQRMILNQKYTDFINRMNRWFEDYFLIKKDTIEQNEGYVLIEFKKNSFDSIKKQLNDFIWFISLNFYKWNKTQIHKYIKVIFELEEENIIELLNEDFSYFFNLKYLN